MMPYVLRFRVTTPYDHGFKHGVIEVKVSLWRYALYKVSGAGCLGPGPYNDTVLYDIVDKARNWLVSEGIFDEERFADALVSIAQLLPYNDSLGAGGDPVCTSVDGGVCDDKAHLAVALLKNC